MTSAEALTINVRMVGGELAGKQLDGIADASKRIGAAAKEGTSQASGALAMFEQTNKRSASEIMKAHNGFFAGFRDGWTKARKDAQDATGDIARVSEGGAQQAFGGWRDLFSGFRDGWSEAKKNAEEATRDMGDKGGKAGEGFAAKFGSKLMAGIAALGIGSFLWDSVQSAIDSQSVQTQLADNFSRFPGLADTSIDKINALAAARAKLTRFDSDSTVASANSLAVLRLTGTQITTLLPLIQDYAAKTGKDMSAATKSVTDAFLGNTDALRDVGITYKATGSAGNDYLQMVKALRIQTGGFAETEGSTAAGRLEQLKNRFGDLQEKLGEALLPYLVKFGDWLQQTGVPLLEKVADWVGANIVPAFKSMAEWVGEHVWPAVKDLGHALGDLWDDLEPVRKIVGGALVLAFEALGKSIEIVAGALEKVVGFLKWIIDNIEKIPSWVKSVGDLNPSDEGQELISRDFLSHNSFGGVMPGYAPGRDTIPALLSPGEGVLVPELVRQIGPSNILQANAAASAGRRGFAFGGIAGSNPTYTNTDPITSVFSGAMQTIAAAVGASVQPSGSDPVDRWRPVVEQALKMTGEYTASNLASMMYRLGYESSGNASAINLWDRNAKNGTPSKGLMQVIDPTFRAYAMPGYDRDIWDPLSNMLASIRYAEKTYGSLSAAYNKAGGYDQGGWLQPGGGIGINMLNKPEPVLTPDQWQTAKKAIDNHAGQLSPVTIEAGAFVFHGASDPDAIAAMLEERVPQIMARAQRGESQRSL